MGGAIAPPAPPLATLLVLPLVLQVPFFKKNLIMGKGMLLLNFCNFYAIHLFFEYVKSNQWNTRYRKISSQQE